MACALKIPLSDFLSDTDGEIRIAGHRISLYDVLWEYNQGKTVEELALRFPTVKRATLHRVIAFYLDNQPEVDAYLAACAKDIEDARTRGQPAPSVAELQQRLEHIRRTAQNAAQISH